MHVGKSFKSPSNTDEKSFSGNTRHEARYATTKRYTQILSYISRMTLLYITYLHSFSYILCESYKFYVRYNNVVYDYKLSLAHTLNDLFHTPCYAVVSILVLTTIILFTLVLPRAHEGCDRSAEHTYSLKASDSTSFTFITSGPCKRRGVQIEK
jgi:hypothetical protein